MALTFSLFLWLISFVLSLIRLFCPNFRKKNISSGNSPFVVIPIEELPSNLPTPLRVKPSYVEREFQKDIKPGMQIFLGSSGVGKTRESIEYIQKLSSITGAKFVYLVKGHIDATAPLPDHKDVEKVIVMIDGYDWGIEDAASNSFLERQAANKEALVNLNKLYNGLKSKLDLHALVVTINQHRLPVNSNDIEAILPECELLELPPVTHQEFREFITAIASTLELIISDENLESIVKLCDGRFDTIAIFLSSFDKGTEIQPSDVQKYSDNLLTIWSLFKEKLSDEQKSTYENMKMLKDFKLPPRIKYIQKLLDYDHIYMKEKEIRQLVSSTWSINNSQAIVYDGQFGPPEYSLELSKKIIHAVLKSASLRHGSRYSFQEETKALGSVLTQFSPSKLQTKMLCKLRKWYPQDRYFAYLLALAYSRQEKWFRGILTIYRVFNQFDAREILIGKWIQIKLHLLLADLYQFADKDSKRHWKRHKYIEKEFKLALLSADDNFPNLSFKDYGEPYRLDGTPVTEEEKRFLENSNKELGLDIPPAISVDSKYLRAMVHYKYSEYLLDEIHREHDSLKHAEVVTKLLPEFGEAYLNCAEACLGIGNTQRALAFAEQADGLLPEYLNSIIYDSTVSWVKWQAYRDLGNITLAQKSLDRYYELSQHEPLCHDSKLKKQLDFHKSSSETWKLAEEFASIRQKEFSDNLTYNIPSLGIHLNLPSTWKIDREEYLGDVVSVLFAPTATWNDTEQCPNDASVSVLYSTRHLALSAEDFGMMLLGGPMFEGQTVTMIEGPTDYKTTTICHWNFKVDASWAKEGIVVAFASPTYRIHIFAMCQLCGKDIFWPTLTSTVESFTQNLLNDSTWKLKANGRE